MSPAEGDLIRSRVIGRQGTAWNCARPRLDVGRGGADIIEVHGRIKWFDMAKGFGFVVPDNGLADILLHVTVLRRDGFQAAPEGAEVICQAQNARVACKSSA